MSESNTSPVYLTIDMLRCRFRIPARTLCALGNPKYIQFLVNPEELFIAILGSDKPIVGGTANRVRISNDKARKSVEFYSSTLLYAIMDIFGSMDYSFNYKFVGEVDEVNRIAYFAMKNVAKVERRRVNERKGISTTAD